MHVDWTANPVSARAERLRTAAAAGRATGRTPAVTLPVPVSASQPARRDEIPGLLGAGG